MLYFLKRREEKAERSKGGQEKTRGDESRPKETRGDKMRRGCQRRQEGTGGNGKMKHPKPRYTIP